MAEPTRGLLDTSVVVDHDRLDHALLPDESAIAAVTLAELAAGPHAAKDEMEKARRQDRLQWAAALWDPLPFDSSAARAYGRAGPAEGDMSVSCVMSPSAVSGEFAKLEGPGTVDRRLVRRLAGEV